MADEGPPAKKIKKEVGTEKSKTQSTEGLSIIERLVVERTNTAQSVADFKFNKKRVRVLSKSDEIPDNCGGIVYWMSRDQRVQDNWSFLYAQRMALKQELPLHVCFCLVPNFLGATIRHFGFMLKGLREVEQECKKLDIPFHLLIGYAKDSLTKFLEDNKIGTVVTDFSPLRVPRNWVSDVVANIKSVPICQVDAHNLVPCWEASPKLEYGARTIRGKIQKQLPTYLTQFPPVIKHPHKPPSKPEPIDWDAAYASLVIDKTVGEVDWAQPGTNAGLKMLDEFCKERLKHFATDRNNPNKKALSNLSPWLHFGQISAQRCILEVKKFKSKYGEAVDAYIEETVIRRELSDNFCFYNENYDKIEGAYDWAKKSLDVHRTDKREFLYTREEFENAKTHDDLWNAAQIQMTKEGKMHGFLRMYWAKKILEWTKSPEEALEIAIYLNDRFNLDGRDPNGYVGCAWSIVGIHDQGWKERPVFGKIRYMNYAGCKRKFDVPSFVRKYGGVSHIKKK